MTRLKSPAYKNPQHSIQILRTEGEELFTSPPVGEVGAQ
jgi:hypothetical protein